MPDRNAHIIQQFTPGKPWVVLGSSPSAPAWLDPALVAAGPGAVVVTANAGVKLLLDWQQPFHVYWLSDWKACELFGPLIPLARAAGAKIATLRRSQFGLESRGLGQADMLLDLHEHDDQAEPAYRPAGAWCHPTLSGLILLQLALRCQARRVFLVGMEGYRSRPGHLVIDSFDGRLGKDGSEAHLKNSIRPFVQSAINECPGTEFVFCGLPNYPLSMRGRMHATGMGVGNVLMPTSPAALSNLAAHWAAEPPVAADSLPVFLPHPALNEDSAMAIKNEPAVQIEITRNLMDPETGIARSAGDRISMTRTQLKDQGLVKGRDFTLVTDRAIKTPSR
jgi:hypothetical protein